MGLGGRFQGRTARGNAPFGRPSTTALKTEEFRSREVAGRAGDTRCGQRPVRRQGTLAAGEISNLVSYTVIINTEVSQPQIVDEGFPTIADNSIERDQLYFYLDFETFLGSLLARAILNGRNLRWFGCVSWLL